MHSTSNNPTKSPSATPTSIASSIASRTRSKRKVQTADINDDVSDRKRTKTNNTSIHTRTVSIPTTKVLGKQAALAKIKQWVDKTKPVVTQNKDLTEEQKEDTIQHIKHFAHFLTNNMDTHGMITAPIILSDSNIPSLPEGIKGKYGISLKNLYALTALPNEIQAPMLRVERCGLSKVKFGPDTNIPIQALFIDCDALHEIDLGSKNTLLTAERCHLLETFKYHNTAPLKGLYLTDCVRFTQMPRELWIEDLELKDLPKVILPQKIILSGPTQCAKFNNITIDTMPYIEAKEVVCDHCNFKDYPSSEGIEACLLFFKEKYGMHCLASILSSGQLKITFYPIKQGTDE